MTGPEALARGIAKLMSVHGETFTVQPSGPSFTAVKSIRFRTDNEGTYTEMVAFVPNAAASIEIGKTLLNAGVAYRLADIRPAEVDTHKELVLVRE